MLARALRGLLVAGALLAFTAPAQAGVSVLDNGVVRVGVDVAQGGKLTWLSRSRGEHADNLLMRSEQSPRDRQHFVEENATDNGFPIVGALRVRVEDLRVALVCTGVARTATSGRVMTAAASRSSRTGR